MANQWLLVVQNYRNHFVILRLVEILLEIYRELHGGQSKHLDQLPEPNQLPRPGKPQILEHMDRQELKRKTNILRFSTIDESEVYPPGFSEY